ncbi:MULTISPECIES: CDP-glycerol glycerophosphotransferase family protein [unclassified Thioalkalivibrio]|uniref:CDP-glycerol glycerophosphotransferase family protein n=1 Tax=unclassified Thioalkalivibrio TaxID=2621013 RepID=UPI0003795007|nr:MULTISPECIES: CDP-glycerol glycerophosphotransferase family protein [unclassified Thioalkalivibrio]
MKIDKRNPVHWMLLGSSAIMAVAAVLLRPLLRERKRTDRARRVLLYGHKLNGNLLALYNAVRNDEPGLKIQFLTLDPAYHRSLRSSGVDSVLAITPSAALELARADAIISDHGLHTLQVLLEWTDIRFFDVWHGIPFKGFDADDFRVQHRYDEIWVASPLHRQLYVDRFGFDPNRVVATGYPRTDRLVAPESTNAETRQRLGLPPSGPVILFAPTWAQDDAQRAIYPFGETGDRFLKGLSDVAARHNGCVILRPHLNTREPVTAQQPRVHTLASDAYPDTEEILQVSDILICDWSSIAFDFLLLQRPTIFLETPAPFRKAFSLGPEWRFGPVVDDLPALLAILDTALDEPDRYWEDYRQTHQSTLERLYQGYADGQASQRCIERLQSRIGPSTS